MFHKTDDFIRRISDPLTRRLRGRNLTAALSRHRSLFRVLFHQSGRQETSPTAPWIHRNSHPVSPDIWSSCILENAVLARRVSSARTDLERAGFDTPDSRCWDRSCLVPVAILVTVEARREERLASPADMGCGVLCPTPRIRSFRLSAGALLRRGQARSRSAVKSG